MSERTRKLRRPRKRAVPLTRRRTGGAIGTAYHEAGHAVLQHALRIGCEAATIVPDFDEGTSGTATHGGEFGKRGRDLGEEDDDAASLRLWAQDAFLLRHAIANYAGAEAVRRWKPRRRNWEAGAESDYREATYRINEITPDAESIDLLFKYARRRCAILVENYWPEITGHREATAQASRDYRRSDQEGVQ